MITSTQITNTEIFAFVAVLVFQLLSRDVLFTNRKETVKEWLLFKKIAYFTGKLLQSYKYLACEIFRALLKPVRNHLLVLFQFS